MLKARQKMVHDMFSCSGDEFIQLVLKNCRSGVSALSPELRKKMHGEKHELDGFVWWKLNPNGTPKGRSKKILYVHGGGWVVDSGVSQYLFVDYLIKKTGCEVWFPEYPVIPEHTGIEALEMVTGLYKMMLQECSGGEIALGGDSAGGGLAMSLAEHLREIGLPQPNNIFLISPGFFESTKARNEEERVYQKITSDRDAIVSLNAFPTCLEYWKGDLDEDDYRINPARGDLHDLAPMLVFCGGYECMENGIRNFVEKAISADANICYLVRNHKSHNYVFCEDDTETEKGMIVERILNPAK